MTGETVSPWCVKLLRTAGEWSREDLAEATGVTPDALADYEEGRRPVTREMLEDMIAGLQLTEEDALSFGASIPRARPWRQAGPDLSADEKSMIGRLTAQIGREVETEIGRNSRSLPGFSGIVQSVWGRFFVEMLIREGSEWEEVWHPRPEDRFEGAELWSRLERFPARDRNLLVDATQEFAHWSLCERVCLQSADLSGEDPRQALGLAELAVRIAVRVPGEDNWRSRLHGFALAHLAQARFSSGDLTGAAETFRDALRHWKAGAPGDPSQLLDGTALEVFEACLLESEGAREMGTSRS